MIPGITAARRRTAAGGSVPAALQGATLWLDFTDASKLYKTTSGTLVSANGDALQVAQDANGKSLCGVYGGAAPTYNTTAGNGGPASSWPGGSTAYMEIKATSSPGIPTGTAKILSDLLALGASTMCFVVKPTSAAGDPNRGIFCDATGGYWYWYYTNSPSGTYNYVMNTYSGGAHSVTVSKSGGSQWVVVSVRHSGTSLQSRLNGGSWQSTTSGNPSYAAAARIGRGYVSNTIGGYLAHASLFNTALSDADLLTVEQYLGADLGLTIP